MDANKFLVDYIRPVLSEMDMFSAPAEKLLLMTACHESGGFRTKVQDGGGPARSYFQVEPTTLEDLSDNYLRYRPHKIRVLEKFEGEGDSLAEMLLDNRYSVAVARMIYSRVPEPLPAVEDNKNMARYWKTYWNTHLGAGTVKKFLADWKLYRPEGYHE
ncbi:MAG: hypothetical protein COB09_16990 [Thalassobium sp.]|nr:MAG: hypothetical protein COB09_16990 [Thalassobium sp.]